MPLLASGAVFQFDMSEISVHLKRPPGSFGPTRAHRCRPFERIGAATVSLLERTKASKLRLS
jgi:hypothetical protein